MTSATHGSTRFTPRHRPIAVTPGKRTAIVGALSTIDDFRSAPANPRSVVGAWALGLTTVYRALQALAADGAIDVIIADDGEARYRLCSRGPPPSLGLS